MLTIVKLLEPVGHSVHPVMFYYPQLMSLRAFIERIRKVRMSNDWIERLFAIM